MSFKIYTKTGDKGETSLIGGTRLPKYHIRIEAYGTVDELNCHIGLLRDVIEGQNNIDLLINIQDRLFTIGSHLAADPKIYLSDNTKNKMKLPPIYEKDIEALENAIDKLNEVLPEMKFFILPGGHPFVSYCHIARSVCRRAERAVLRLSESEKVEMIHSKYLNRLSDYLFMLSRWLSIEKKINEIPWKPKL